MIGQVIGNYKIIEKIGQGGMGEVYKAVDVNLDRTVAIKVLPRELSQDASLIQRFQAEAKTQAQLNHPNICTLYSLFKYNEQLLMVMEFVEGQDLDHMIRQRGPTPFQEAVPLFQQALFGLSQAHRMGVIHRDIKPSNFIVNKQGVVKVMDFGIARVLGQSRMTRTGVAVGTLFYMSPEQIMGKEVDFRGDIYSLGITLFELLTGTVPFQVTTDFEIMNAHVKETPPPPSKAYPYLPKVFDKVVARALEKDPAKRFQTVEEFSQALGLAMQEALKTAPPPTAARTVAYTPGATAARTATGAPPPGTTGAYSPGPTAMYAPGTTGTGMMMPPLPESKILGLDRKTALLVAAGVGGVVLLGVVLGLAFLIFGGKNKKDVQSPLSASGSSTVSQGNASGQAPVSSPATFPSSGNSTTQGKVDLSRIPGLENKTDQQEPSEPQPPEETQPARRGGTRTSPAAQSGGQTARPEPEPQNPPFQSPAQGSSVEENDPLKALSAKAHQAYQQGRYIEPPGDNVVDYTSEILRSDPGNSYARELRSEAAAQVESQVQQAISGGNLAAAKRLCRMLVEHFPDNAEYRNALKGLDVVEQQAAAMANAQVFLVGHDHSGDFGTYCVGQLYIMADRIIFKTIQTTDGRRDDFEANRDSIKEFKKNTLPIGGYRAFHVKLKNGRNFNFAQINQQYQDLGPDAVVGAYHSAD